MNSDRFFQEVSRIVKPYNVEAEGLKENGAFYFSFGGEPLFHAVPNGAIYYSTEHLDTQEKKTLCAMVAEAVGDARVYVDTVENASPLKAVDLRDGYKLLGEYGNIVLAGRDMGEYGYQFVTWRYTYDRKGVTLGHYYHNDYAGAKEDFAVRSGLVSEHKLFKDEELQAIYRTLEQGRKYIPFLTFDHEKEILDIQNRIEGIAPKAVEAFKEEQAAQSKKPVFRVRIMAGDIKNDLLELRKDTKGDPLVHELMLPATDEALQAAYDFGAENEPCYQTVQGVRYPLPFEDMAASDLNSLNDSAMMIDRMNDMEIADLWLSLRIEFLEYEHELKEICEAVLSPSAIRQNHITMSSFSE